MRGFKKVCLDLLFPPKCYLCDSKDNLSDFGLCAKCDPLLLLPGDDELWDRSFFNLQDDCCIHCGELAYETCVSCRLEKLPFENLISCWRFKGTVESLIKIWKYGDAFSLASFFGHAGSKVLRKIGYLNANHQNTIIVSVPSHLESLKQRGFSHTALFGNSLSKQINMPYKPKALSVSARCYESSSKYKAHQAGLSLKKRLENTSFRYTARKDNIKGKQILLIDDLTTTGLSLASAANELLDSGAENITAFTLARSTRFANNRNSLLLANKLQELKSIPA